MLLKLFFNSLSKAVLLDLLVAIVASLLPLVGKLIYSSICDLRNCALKLNT